MKGGEKWGEHGGPEGEHRGKKEGVGEEVSVAAWELVCGVFDILTYPVSVPGTVPPLSPGISGGSSTPGRGNFGGEDLVVQKQYFSLLQEVPSPFLHLLILFSQLLL